MSTALTRASFRGAPGPVEASSVHPSYARPMSATETLRRATELHAEGDWQGAHAIVQDAPSSLAALRHGIVHLLEGDTSNGAQSGDSR